MQRRLTLAIACMHDPALLVAEEPEAGLDPHSRALIRDFLSRYGRDHTLVFSSHHVADVERLADVVAVLNDGRVVALGHPRAVARMAMSKRPRVPGPRRVRSRSGHAGRAASPRTAEVAA
jgi:ABC-type multidrug transport system ATPase subunit